MRQKPVERVAVASESRKTLSLAVNRSNVSSFKGQRLVDVLDAHLAQSSEYMLLENASDDACGLKEAPSEEVAPRILGQDYNQDLASWLRSCCNPMAFTSKQRGSRFRPYVPFAKREVYEERIKLSQKMREKQRQRKAPELPPHWSPEKSTQEPVEGFESLLRPPTLRHIMGKFLAEKYNQGYRITPKEHKFKCKMYLALKEGAANDEDSAAFIGPPCPSLDATVPNNDDGQIFTAYDERARLRRWFVENHLKADRKKVDAPFRYVDDNIANPTKVEVSDVAKLVDWLRENADVCASDDYWEGYRISHDGHWQCYWRKQLTERERLDQWLKRKNSHNYVAQRDNDRDANMIMRIYRKAVRKYSDGVISLSVLLRLTRRLWPDREHVPLSVPKGNVTLKDRIYYGKYVSKYLRGELSPHRLSRLYKILFPNGQDSKNWSTYKNTEPMNPVGIAMETCATPIRVDVFTKEESRRADWLFDNRPAVFHHTAPLLGYQSDSIIHPTLFTPVEDEPDVMTEDESRLADFIRAQLHSEQNVKRFIRDSINALKDESIMEMSLAADEFAGVVAEKVVEILDKRRGPKDTIGFKNDRLTGFYMPEPPSYSDVKSN